LRRSGGPSFRAPKPDAKAAENFPARAFANPPAPAGKPRLHRIRAPGPPKKLHKASWVELNLRRQKEPKLKSASSKQGGFGNHEKTAPSTIFRKDKKIDLQAATGIPSLLRPRQEKISPHRVE